MQENRLCLTKELQDQSARLLTLRFQLSHAHIGPKYLTMPFVARSETESLQELSLNQNLKLWML